MTSKFISLPWTLYSAPDLHSPLAQASRGLRDFLDSLTWVSFMFKASMVGQVLFIFWISLIFPSASSFLLPLPCASAAYSQQITHSNFHIFNYICKILRIKSILWATPVDLEGSMVHFAKYILKSVEVKICLSF